MKKNRNEAKTLQEDPNLMAQTPEVGEGETQNLEEHDVAEVVETQSPPEETSSPVLNYIVANCKKLNIRKKPYKDSDIVSVLPVGTTLTVNAASDTGWARVHLSDGTKGYAMLEFIKEI